MRSILVVLLLLLVLPLTGCGVHVVDSGNTGVKKVLGEVKQDPYPPGMYFVNPMTSTIIEMDNHIIKWSEKTNVYTKDVQQADVSFALNYSLLPSASVRMYATVGENWSDTLVPQVVSGAMKNVIGQWDAIELVAKRAQASQDIETQIAEALKSSGIAVTGFQITNIQFKPEFEAAVEAKQVAVQKAEQSRNETVQIQEQAKQRVIAAQADAEAMKIKTDALEKSQSLVLYEAVQKWDGHTPSIVTVGSGSGSILNIPSSVLGQPAAK
jgi:prohibitin 2